MLFRDKDMKLTIRVQDIVSLVKQFETSPTEALCVLKTHMQAGAKQIIERVLESEIELFLGQSGQSENKRNGYITRQFAFKGIGALELRVPRDRQCQFSSNVVPKGRKYEEALEKDLALLHLAGLSTRTMSYVSRRILGLSISPQEVSNSIKTILPAAERFLERDLSGRKFKYLWVDGTNFNIRRTTVDREPTLVVIGVDEEDKKSVLAMIQGDKDAKSAWEMVFYRLKERGLDSQAVQLGIMDGLPGLPEAFLSAFPKSQVARCWIHKARNVMPLVARRYQAAFKTDWDKIAYANGRTEASKAFSALKLRWQSLAKDAVNRFERDLEMLLVHYDFPRVYWDALRTTNPIERVNKELKRRSKSMEQLGSENLKALLAFTALRLEYGWSLTPITSNKLSNLSLSPFRPPARESSFEAAVQGLAI